MKRTALYAGVGPNLCHYEIDVEQLTLSPRDSLRLPGNTQYIWPHACQPFLYIACSNRVSISIRNRLGMPAGTPAGGAGSAGGTDHHLVALKIDPRTGAISPHGDALRLSHRPVHLTNDRESRHALLAFDTPAEVQVYGIREDGRIGARVPQRDGIDWGLFAHQVRVTADDRLALLATRGNPFLGKDAHLARQVDPGAMKIFEYRDGRLGEESSIAPGGGHHFGARYVEFHPSGRWVFLATETQNKLYVFERRGDRILPEPLFIKDTLQRPDRVPTPQIACALEMHPNGRFLYCSNRAHIPTDYQGRKVMVDADNSFAVYAVDEASGEPTLIQNIDSGGVFTRTFAIHPSGRMLVACNGEQFLVKQGDQVREVTPGLSVFAIQDDGRLRFVRKYETESDPVMRLWMCMASYEAA